jgi:hypothetical protein
MLDRHNVPITMNISEIANSPSEAVQQVEARLDAPKKKVASVIEAADGIELDRLGTPWLWTLPDGRIEMEWDTKTTITAEKQPVCRFKNIKLEGEHVGTFPVEVDPITDEERGPLPG